LGKGDKLVLLQISRAFLMDSLGGAATEFPRAVWKPKTGLAGFPSDGRAFSSAEISIGNGSPAPVWNSEDNARRGFDRAGS